MKLFRRRKKSERQKQHDDLIRTQMREKLQVEILGKGSHPVSVDETTTVKDLKDILNIGLQVQAVDEDGRRLSNDAKVIDTESKTSGNKKVTFIPNVKGGTWMMK